MSGPIWTRQELNVLQECVGDVPWPLVANSYNGHARLLGYPLRTLAAIRHKCNHLRISKHTTGEWIRVSLVCTMLGISHSTVNRWIKSNRLVAKQFAPGKKGSAFYFKRLSLRKFARANPYFFGGQSVSMLTQLLDSEYLANEIVSMNLPRPSFTKPVKCIETGKVFASMTEASRHVFISRRCIAKAIDDQSKTAANYHWESSLSLCQ